MDKKLLISFKEYSSIKHNQPYFYSVQSSHQVLYYFGAEHKRDPSHHQYELLHKEWQDFLEKTSSGKSIVIFEGSVNINTVTTFNEAVEKYGESGAIVFWASKAEIPYFRPEPSIKDEVNELLRNFSKEEIFYFYIIRGIVTWQRKIVPDDFNEFIKKNIQRYQGELDWNDFDFSLESVKNEHKKLFNKEFSLDDKDFINKIPNPTRSESIINDIARESTTIRNLAILGCIEDYWQKGHNIFVVYGASHAVMQEPVIKSLV